MGFDYTKSCTKQNRQSLHQRFYSVHLCNFIDFNGVPLVRKQREREKKRKNQIQNLLHLSQFQNQLRFSSTEDFYCRYGFSAVLRIALQPHKPFRHGHISEKQSHAKRSPNLTRILRICHLFNKATR